MTNRIYSGTVFFICLVMWVGIRILVQKYNVSVKIDNLLHVLYPISCGIISFMIYVKWIAKK